MSKFNLYALALTCAVLLGACQQQQPIAQNSVQTNGKMTKYYTLEEAATHDTYEDCWLVIEGKVYDITTYIDEHPGQENILEGCGMDATTLYENRPMGSGTPHSEKARTDLEKYYIGELSDTSADAATPTDTGTPQNGESADQSAALTYDPCLLLLPEDLSAHFPGQTATATTHDTEANVVGQKICFYEFSEEDMVFAQLSFTNQKDLSPSVVEGGQNAETLFAGIKEFAENPESVSGLGTEAYYGGSGLTPGAGLNVLVKDKGVFFTVTVGLGMGNDDETAHLEIEKDLAAKILSRL